MTLFGLKKKMQKRLMAIVSVALALTLLPAQSRGQEFSLFDALIQLAQPTPAQPVECPVCQSCPQGVSTGPAVMPCCPISGPVGESRQIGCDGCANKTTEQPTNDCPKTEACSPVLDAIGRVLSEFLGQEASETTPEAKASEPLVINLGCLKVVFQPKMITISMQDETTCKPCCETCPAASPCCPGLVGGMCPGSCGPEVKCTPASPCCPGVCTTPGCSGAMCPAACCSVQAERDYNIGCFWEQTGHPGSAHFCFEIVMRRYPGTLWAKKAEKKLLALRATARREAGHHAQVMQELQPSTCPLANACNGCPGTISAVPVGCPNCISVTGPAFRVMQGLTSIWYDVNAMPGCPTRVDGGIAPRSGSYCPWSGLTPDLGVPIKSTTFGFAVPPPPQVNCCPGTNGQDCNLVGEIRAALESHDETARRMYVDQDRTIREMKEIIEQMSQEVSVMRQDLQIIRTGQPVQFQPPYNGMQQSNQYPTQGTQQSMLAPTSTNDFNLPQWDFNLPQWILQSMPAPTPTSIYRDDRDYFGAFYNGFSVAGSFPDFNP